MKRSTRHEATDHASDAGWLPAGYPPLRDLGWPERLAVVFALGHIVGEHRIALSQSFLVLAVIAAAVAIRKGRLRIEPDPLYVPLILYAAGSSLASLLAPGPLAASRVAGAWFNLLVFPLMLLLLRQVRGFGRAAAAALILLLGVNVSWGLAQFVLLGQRDLEHRITGPAPHVMTYSGILMPLCVVTTILFLERRRIWIGAFAAAGSVGLVATLTRSAWLGWFVGIGLWMVLRRSRSLLWLAPATVLFLTFAPLSVFGRMISTFDVRQYSNLDRIRMFEAGVDIIRDHPVLGVGPENISEVYARYRRPDAPRFYVPHLHNNIIQIWAERGVIALFGFLLWFGMVGARFLEIARRPGYGTLGRAGIAMVAALFTAGLFEFNFGDSEVLMTMLVLTAVLLAIGEGTLAGGAEDPNGTGSPVVPTG